jgi:hypothetical protein
MGIAFVWIRSLFEIVLEQGEQKYPNMDTETVSFESVRLRLQLKTT